jgi:hypothetical protein
MDTARPLRDVFAELSRADLNQADLDQADLHTGPGTAEDVLRANGHADLPGGLVAEAVGNYADTAPIEVAQHLAPYVMAHSAVPLPDLPEVGEASWVDLVATAPTGPDLIADPTDALDPSIGGTHPAGPDRHDLDTHDLDPHDLDTHDLDTHDVAFGHGVGEHDLPARSEDTVDSDDGQHHALPEVVHHVDDATVGHEYDPGFDDLLSDLHDGHAVDDEHHHGDDGGPDHHLHG